MKQRTHPDKLTVAAAAAALRVSRQAVSAWIAAGRVPAERSGRSVLIRAADLDALRVAACPVCGKPVKAIGSRQAYCSPACRQKAYRQRAAQRPPPPHRPAVPVTDDPRLAQAVAQIRQKAATATRQS